MSDFLRPHGLQHTRLLCPWDFPGKNTGVGCHCLPRLVPQLCPTLRDPMDCSTPGSSVHGIFQARVLEWGAIAFSKEISSLSHYIAFLYFFALIIEEGFLMSLRYSLELCIQMGKSFYSCYPFLLFPQPQDIEQPCSFYSPLGLPFPIIRFQFSSVQSFSPVRLLATP